MLSGVTSVNGSMHLAPYTHIITVSLLCLRDNPTYEEIPMSQLFIVLNRITDLAVRNDVTIDMQKICKIYDLSSVDLVKV